MNGLVRGSKLYFKRNASTILTVVGGAGVVTTTVLGIKATPKALKLIENAEKEKGEKLTKLEKVEVAAPVYIPTMLAGAGTLACIFGANILNKRQQAGLMSAYALLDNSYKEYKAKVEELHGEGTNERITDEIAKDKYEEQKIEPKDETQLFYDEFSGRYFRSTPTRVMLAEYNVNRGIHHHGGALLSEFYKDVGLEDDVEEYSEIGWTEGGNYENYWQAWVDFNHRTVIPEDGEGEEYTSIMMYQEPYVDFNEY